jgi:hypothetical protein
VIGNHLTLDLVLIGPSVSNYRANMKMEGDFTFDKEDVENEILLKMLDRFPMLDELLTNKANAIDHYQPEYNDHPSLGLKI